MRIALVGDVMLGRLVDRCLRDAEPTYPWGDTLPHLAEADWRACNLECVLSDRGQPWQPWHKVFHFRSAARNAAVLRAAHVDAVSLANNHAYDYGEEALRECLAVLDRAGIRHAGAGLDLARARAPAIGHAAGTRVGLVAFTDNEPDWEAAPRVPGVQYFPVELADARTGAFLDDLSRLRREVDVLLVSAHWGPNWGVHPPHEHIAFAHAAIDAGATVVWGHSPHEFRGVERYRGGAILYSAGDFVDDYAVDPLARNDQSFIFELDVRAGVVTALHMRPTVIRAFQARLATGEESEAIALRMMRRCAELGTSTRWDSQRGVLSSN